MFEVGKIYNVHIKIDIMCLGDLKFLRPGNYIGLLIKVLEYKSIKHYKFFINNKKYMLLIDEIGDEVT